MTPPPVPPRTEGSYLTPAFVRSMSISVDEKRRQTLRSLKVPSVDDALGRHGSSRTGGAVPAYKPTTATSIATESDADAQAGVSGGAGANAAAETEMSTATASQEEEDEDEEAYLDEDRKPSSRAELLPSPGGPLGFPNRLAKPRGARAIPSVWGQPWQRTELVYHVVLLGEASAVGHRACEARVVEESANTP